MKRRSLIYRTLTAFLSALMVVTGVHTDVFAAPVTVEINSICPRTTCNEHIHASGPYANLDDTIDTAVPYLGGKTYREACADPGIHLTSNFEKFHMYILYCPEYDHDEDRISRHTMTVLFPQHGYSIGGYTQCDDVGHYINYVCDHSNTEKYSLSQELCGSGALLKNAVWKGFLENDTIGCGATMDEYEEHTTWTYGQWTKKDDTRHQRPKSCSKCGYTVIVTGNHGWRKKDYVSLNATTHQYTKYCASCEAFSYATEPHEFVYGPWEYISGGSTNARQHFRTVTCAKCDFTTVQYADHSFVYVSEDYFPSSAMHHYRMKKCTVCDLGVGEYTLHVYDPQNKVYEDLDDTQHNVRNNCTLCGWEDVQTEEHSYTSAYESLSDTRHRHTRTCICGHTIVTEGDHHDDDNDCYCDECGYLMTRFSVTVPATLSLVMDRDGNVYSATNAAIYNNSTAAVEVNRIELDAQNGWSVVPYSTDMANEKVDSKQIGFKLRAAESGTDTQMTLAGDWSVGRDDELPLPYDAVVSASTTPIDGETVLQVTFIIDWRD